MQHSEAAPAEAGSTAANQSTNAAASAAKINGEMYMADGDYIKDIEINDLRNRYVVTKGSTQQMVNIYLGHLG
jgi:hypothetical protein